MGLCVQCVVRGSRQRFIPGAVNPGAPELVNPPEAPVGTLARASVPPLNGSLPPATAVKGAAITQYQRAIKRARGKRHSGATGIETLYIISTVTLAH
jgi:hypothetical protein